MRLPSSPLTRMSQYLAVGLGLLICLPTLALAFDPPKGGLPGRREPAGTRGTQCVTNSNNKNLTALMPESNLGLTVKDYPTLFWYVPTNSAKALEFVLADENDQPIYKTSFATTGNPGIVSVSVPPNMGLAPLVKGKNYRWTFSLICDMSDRSGNISVQGWVQRIEPTAALKSKLEKATLQERPGIYAASGIWFETLSSLVDLRRANPNDQKLASDWASLLQSVKLDKISKEPLAGCCAPVSTAPNPASVVNGRPATPQP